MKDSSPRVGARFSSLERTPLTFRYSVIEWSVLVWTAFASGAVLASTVIMAVIGLSMLPASYLLPFMPGALLGIVRFITKYSAARIPFLTVSVLSIAGLVWTMPSELLDGLLLVFALVVTMAISVLYNTRERWLIAARWFTTGALASGGFMLLDFVINDRTRLGSYFYDGNRVVEPNLAGVLFAMVVLIQMTLLWNYGPHSQGRVAVMRTTIVVFLGLLLLSGSRGAQISFAAAALVFFLKGRVRINRKAIQIAAFAIPATIAVYWGVFGTPDLLVRFTSGGVSTFGGRLSIWESAFTRMHSWNDFRAFLGEGTGSAPYSIGATSPELAQQLMMNFFSGYTGGVPRINAHSGYIEWVLTFGTIGLLIGVGLLANAAINSLRVDSGKPGASGMSFLCLFMMVALTLVAYRMAGVSVVCGGIALGYIYMRLDTERTCGELRTGPGD